MTEWQQQQAKSRSSGLIKLVLAGLAILVTLVVLMRPGEDVSPTDSQTWMVGDVFRDCRDCPSMVVIPAGRFVMGSKDEPELAAGAWPQREVQVQQFALAKTEVTFRQWDACVTDGGCSHRPDDLGWGRGNRPVIGVSWNDAQEYVRWLSSKTGKDYRLPTEAEWEYAARAGTTTRFNTGDCITSQEANFQGDFPARDCPSSDSAQRTLPVASFGANDFGLHDMHGNASEWVQDCWNNSYRGAPIDGSAWMRGHCNRGVLRGGSWRNIGEALRSAHRLAHQHDYRDGPLGFRPARSP